ncbi:MAG: hypothetical protein IKS08_03790 [Alphaproteobacteria bacterium]|nr:hypothetical protein [Alphaproteobacteria bacterium]
MKQNETVLEIGFGVPIADASQLAVDLAKQRKSTIVFRYNNIEIKVSPKTRICCKCLLFQGGDFAKHGNGW